MSIFKKGDSVAKQNEVVTPASAAKGPITIVNLNDYGHQVAASNGPGGSSFHFPPETNYRWVTIFGGQWVEFFDPETGNVIAHVREHMVTAIQNGAYCRDGKWSSNVYPGNK